MNLKFERTAGGKAKALGLKNGFDFGFRIRLTHSLFYAFLF